MINRDGSVESRTGTQDIGTGQRTTMGIVTAEAIGIPLKFVTVRIGRSTLPPGPGSGGSVTTPMTAPTMTAAAKAAREQFLEVVAKQCGAKAEELGAVVFIHPQPAATPDLGKRLGGNGLLTNVIGNPLETTIALSHLIFEGTLDKFPGLKVIAAHGGGYLPSYADRSDHACLTGPRGCNPDIKLKKKPTE